MEIVGVPTCLVKLLPVAAVIVLPEPAVSCPPAPLQRARLAAQVRWDDVTKLVCLGQIATRRQVESLWVQRINRLAISSGIIRNAIRWGLWTHQQPRIRATIPCRCVANPHLNMTIVVRRDRMLELDHLSTRVGRSDGFFRIAAPTPFCCPPSIQAIIVPRASNWRIQVAMAAST